MFSKFEQHFYYFVLMRNMSQYFIYKERKQVYYS